MTKQSWKKRFDEEWQSDTEADWYCFPDSDGWEVGEKGVNAIKQFIQKELDQAREEERKRRKREKCETAEANQEFIKDWIIKEIKEVRKELEEIKDLKNKYTGKEKLITDILSGLFLIITFMIGMYILFKYLLPN